MRYALLIYHDEQKNIQFTDEENQALMNAHWQLFEEMKSAQVIQPGGPALEPTPTAVSVRVRNGKMLTTDGPFAETKEQLGGLYIVKCDTIEEAAQWAAKIPEAQHGTVEVRPIIDFE
jgi:hypothetical protein